MRSFPTPYGAKPRVSRAFAYEVEAAGVEPAKRSPRLSRAREQKTLGFAPEAAAVLAVAASVTALAFLAAAPTQSPPAFAPARLILYPLPGHTPDATTPNEERNPYGP